MSLLNSRQLASLLKTTLVLTFISGLAICGLGGWFVYLGTAGETSFTLLGQVFKSSSVGLAAIFIGGVLIALTVRRGLKAIEQVTTRTARPTESLSPNPTVRNEGGEKRIDGPSIDSLDALERIVSRLSRTQKDILALTLKFGDDGIHISDLVDGLGLKRAEVVYRARDLQSLGLIEIRNLTDTCLTLSNSLKRLKGQSPSATDAILRQGSKAAQKVRGRTLKEPKNG